jgi:hypothetical protein
MHIIISVNHNARTTRMQAFLTGCPTSEQLSKKIYDSILAFFLPHQYYFFSHHNTTNTSNHHNMMIRGGNYAANEPRRSDALDPTR